MSSGIATPPLPPPDTPIVAPPPNEYETFIDQRLRQTRHQVKGVDIAGGLVTLAIGVLGYLLAAALVDHWLIVGGLGFWGRLLLWIALVAVAGTYFAYCVLPPILHRINPVFAASTIEKSQPSLRNSLINFLLLRGRRDEVAGPVFQAMEYRAAADLSRVRIEVAVDRTHLVRLGCVLAGLVALSSLYLVFSPKNPLRSAARVLWPWSTLEAPTRVTIRDVQPGDATAFHGESVTISAEIAGLRKGESPAVIFSTADGQIADQNVPMTPPEEGHQFQCRLPPGNLGLQQDYEYRLAAGDCRSRRYRIAVQMAPAIEVDKVTYHYPAYTGLPDRTVQRQGDLRAIEGTEVALHATANTEIKPETAQIDLGCTGLPGARMSAAGRAADGHFTLRLNPDDPARPEYEFYQLRFDDLQGRKNPRPIRYRIEVVRDQPPDVQLIEPPKQETAVAEDGELAIKVRAEDPDFALRSVTLRAECDGRTFPIAPLLERRDPEEPWPGEFLATYTFEPAKLKLAAGDRVQYWAEAEDNKEPAANRSTTDKRWITVVGREGRRQSQGKPGNDQAATGNNPEQQAATGNNPEQKAATAGRAEAEQNSPPPGEGQQEQPAEKSGEKAKPGKTRPSNQQPSEQPKQDQNQQPGQAAEKPDQRIDPESNPGDAMQKILQDRDKNQPKPPPKEPKTDQQQPENSKADQPPSEGEQKQSGQQQQNGDQQQSGKQSSQSGGSADQKSKGEKAGGEKSSDEKASSEKAGGEKAGGEKAGGEKAGGEKESGEKAGGEKENGEKAGGEKAGGEKAGGEKESGEKAGGEKENGEKAGGEKAAGEKAGGKKPGDENAANKNSNQQTGEGEPAGGEKQSADKSKKSGKENGTGETPAGQEPDGANPGQKKPTEKPGADTSGGQPSGSKAGGSKPKPPADQQSSGQKPPGEQPPGQQQPGEEPSPKPDKNAGESGGSPMPQGDNKERTEKAGKAGEAPGDKKKDDAQSPSISNHQSTAQSDTPGDRSGAGQQGGGQQSNQSGVGGPGSHSKADEGGKKANEKGEGETGTRAGEQAAASKPTGSAKKGKDQGNGEGTGEKAVPGDQSKGGTPQDHPTDAGPDGRGPTEAPNAHGSANPITGGKPGTPTADKPPEPTESAADEANLDYARRQTELALEHLRDQLDKEKPQLLERLGWTKDEARRFLEQWEGMRRAAAEEGVKGEAARKQFNDAVRSLGLRPRGTELRHGDVAPDQPENLRDAGRFPPPPDWAEQFRAYTRGVAGEERKSEKK